MTNVSMYSYTNQGRRQEGIMKLIAFLKDKKGFLLTHIVTVIFTGIFLSVFHISSDAIYFLSAVYIISIVISLTYEYLPKRNWYSETEKLLEKPEKVTLLSELIEEPLFQEGKEMYHCIQRMNKAMNDEIEKYAVSSKEYREYIELWIHEIKTPIASSKLIIENNPSEITQSLSEDLDVVNYYIEQALFYSRSNNVEKDYIIKEIELRDLVNAVIRRNSKDFIRNRIKLTLDALEYTIYTDSKWLEFILNQIVVNAIKYHKDNPCIRIYANERDNNIALTVEDNGIGISEKDIPMIFERGYTGRTGRLYTKSTGIGLYLCKSLCDKLGLSISIQSEEFMYTKVTIIFPKAKAMDVYKM